MNDIEQPTPADDTVSETIELPEGEQPAEQPVTFEQIVGEDSRLAEGFRNAQKGVYENTLLTMWEDQLRQEMIGYGDAATLDVYDRMLREWHWVRYHDIEPIRRQLLLLTKECLDMLDEAVEYVLAQEKPPRTRKEAFENSEHDWLANKALYIEITARWTAAMSFWGVRWQFAALKDRPILHAAIAIASGRIIGQYSLVEQMKNLADFSITDDENTALYARVNELVLNKQGAGDE